jgi:hypothetical protein
MFVFATQALPALGAEPRETAELRKAREHFRLGKEAYAAERFDDAYREFEEGYQLSQRPLFLLNMGHAKRRAGAAAEARTLYRRFLVAQPDSPYKTEVEAMLAEIDRALPEAPPPPVAPKVVVAPAAIPAPPPAMVRAPVAPVPAPASGGSRWWVWAGAGAVVASVVAVAVLARGGDSYTRQGSLGTLGAP